jgi:hypothetical protein
MQRAAGHVDGGFGAMVGLLHAQDDAGVDWLIEMAFEARELGLDVIAQRGRDLDLLAVGFNSHRRPPWVWTTASPGRGAATDSLTPVGQGGGQSIDHDHGSGNAHAIL